MTKQEFDEMAALVVRLRKDLELHTDALRQSNAHCGKLLVQNEKLHSDLVEVRAALAATTEQRDSYKRTLDEWSNADTKPHERVAANDVADHVVPPVLPMCMTCHGCGMTLGKSAKGPYYWCQNFQCTKKTTQYQDHDASPYWGRCNSKTPVRHE